jgi:hypothetical protein
MLGERPAPLTEDCPPPVAIPPEGRWPGVFIDWYDDGLQVMNGTEVPCVRLLWQIEPRRPDGSRYLVGQRYHRTLGRGSLLRRLLERWEGRRFADAECRIGIDLSQWWRKPCYVTVRHRPWRPGQPWVSVGAVEPWDYAQPLRPLTPENYRTMQFGRAKFKARPSTP